MNHGVRKFWILLVMNFVDLSEAVGIILLWRLVVGSFLTFPMQFLLFGLISFDKGGN